MGKGWLSRKNIIDYVVDLLVNGNDDGVAIIAAGENLTDNKLFKLISNQVEHSDTANDLDKWPMVAR